MPGPRALTWLLGALAAFGPLSVDLYLPALPAIGAGLGATPEQVQLSITVFLAGYTVGMIIYGPLSDRFGRRPVLLGSLALFAAASLACALAGSIEQLVAARLLQALGGGAASVLARAIVRDLFVGADAIRMLSGMAMLTAIAPLVAPLAGSALMSAFNWRYIFGALFAWAAVSLLLVWRNLPESLPRDRRIAVPARRIFVTYKAVLADPAARALLLAGGMSFSAMFSYITAGPFYFISLLGYSPNVYALAFAGNAAGIFLANALNRKFAVKPGPAAMMRIASIVSFGGALLILGGILLGDAPLPTLAGLFVVVSMTGLMGANGVGLLMSRFPAAAGSAAALYGAAQFGLGTLFSIAVTALHDDTGRPMALAIGVACAMSLYGTLRYRHAVAE